MAETWRLARNPSKEPRELLKAALPLARSVDPRAQEELLEALRAESYLARLDPPDDYLRYPARQHRLARIFKLLMMNGSTPAQATLAALALSPTFQDVDRRDELLVFCLHIVRPAPPEVVRYWDRHSTPDHVHLHFTIEALCANGTEPAIELLERRLAEPEQDPDYRQLWIRGAILRHRNDVPLLLGCERMVMGGIPEDLRGVLVEALCDYHRDWYRSDRPPVPPDRALASDEAKDVLRRICRYAKRKLVLTPAAKVAVRRTLKELGEEDDGDEQDEEPLPEEGGEE